MTPSPSQKFENLPYELLFDIVSHLDDCASLYNLLRASPATSRLFNHDGLKLTRMVFSRDNMCDQIRESIHLMTLLDSSSSSPWPYPSLGAFVTGFINVTVRDRFPQVGFPSPIDVYFPRDLPDGTSVPTIRRILSVYAQIKHLTTACLEHYLERFNALRPENIVDPEARYHSSSARMGKIPPWKQRFESFKFPVEDYGPPTWEEDQRVSRALWRIQLFYDLQAAAGQSRLGWPADDVRRLQSMKERDLYVGGKMPYEPQEIDTVIDYLEYARAADHVISEDGGSSRPRRLPFLRLPAKRDWPISQRPDPDTGFFKYIIDIPTFGLREYRTLTRLRFSPIRTAKFDSFQRLGIAFWCQQRIQAIGLCPVYKERSTNASAWLFAWRSILDPREVEAVENRLQTEWEHRRLDDDSYYGWY